MASNFVGYSTAVHCLRQ